MAGRWRLDLHYAGRDFSFVDIDPEISRVIEIGGSAPDPLEVSVEVMFPDLDVAEAVESGQQLDAATGELYLDEALVLSGRVVSPAYGHPEQPTGWASLTVRASPLEDRGIFPPAAAVVSADTWPTHDPAMTGRFYPFVFGAPGSEEYPGSPALLVESADPAPVTDPGHQYVLICDGWAECEQVVLVCPSGGRPIDVGAELGVGAPGVFVITYGKQEANLTCIRTHDGLGRPVTVVDVWEGGTLQVDNTQGVELYVRWDYGAPFSAGMGDMLERMLRASTVPVDWGRMTQARDILNRYRVAGYIEEQSKPLEWIGDNLLPLAQFCLMVSGVGLYALVWPFERTVEHAVAHLVEGPDCEPIDEVGYDGEPLNELTFRYKHRADAEEYAGVVVVDPSNNPYADASRRRYTINDDARTGVYADTIDTDLVHEDSIAHSLAHEMVRLRAFRTRTPRYRLAPEIWDRLAEGMVVTITSAARHWTRRPAVILAIDEDSIGTTATLSIDDDPFRDNH